MNLCRGSTLGDAEFAELIEFLHLRNRMCRVQENVEDDPDIPCVGFLPEHYKQMRSSRVVWGRAYDADRLYAVLWGVIYHETHLHVLSVYLLPSYRKVDTGGLFARTKLLLPTLDLHSYSYFRYTSFKHPSAKDLYQRKVRRWYIEPRTSGMSDSYSLSEDEQGILHYGPFSFFRYALFYNSGNVKEIHVLLAAGEPLARLHYCPKQWFIIGNTMFEGCGFLEVYIENEYTLYSDSELSFPVC